MASNFRVVLQRTNNNLHLKLRGDFDGSSAYELINILKNCDNNGKIFVNTNYLNTIHPFGLRVFQKNLRKPSEKIIFIGKNRSKILP